MNARRLAAVALTAGTLATFAAPASATCYLGQVDICNKPTDPYTDPVVNRVTEATRNPALDPAWGVVGTGMQAYSDAYTIVICLTGDYWYC